MKKHKEKDKPKPFTDHSTLLVFGYASKIFRDDDKASEIDRCEKFIPWNGDPNLKLDRYDGRILLHNLDMYLPREKYSEVEEYERVEEEMCDEERWRALHKDDEEEENREEEEKKRGRLTGGEIGFRYDTENYEDEVQLPTQGPQLPPDHPGNDEDGGEYIPDLELKVPPEILIPPNMKLYSVILKTAKFLSTQGPQMEIFMKAKQSNNPAFQFLNPQDPLHSFYRHLVLMIKSKQYIPDQPAEPVSSLVPQYSTLESTDIAPVIPTIQYKRDEDCSYAKLISRIKSVAPAPQPTQEEPPPPVLAPLPHLPHLSNLHGSTPPLTLSPPPLYLQPESYPGMHPEQHTGMHPEQYPVMHPDLQADYSVPSPPGEEDVPPGTEEPLSIPPPDLQTIIDKMASYVARNGRSFEEVVRIKDSVRFSFLFKGDKHHSYYVHKLNLYTTGNYDAKLAPEPLAFKVKKAEVKEPILPAPSALPVEESEDEDEKEEEEEDEGPPGDTDFPPPVLKAEPKIYEKEEEKLRAKEETKLKDKLAAAAREKMMIQAKEKAVQLERKRKAAVFLAQLAEKRTTVSSVEPIQSTDLEDGELPVGCWPPPAPPGPPQLVIPTLAGPVIQSISSDSDSESRRKRSSRKRKNGSRYRSRSRSRNRKKRKHRSRSRSRSRHKKKKEKRSRRLHRSRSRRSRSRSVSRTRRSRSRSIKRISRSRSVKGIDSDDSIEVVSQSSSHTKESTPNLEEPPRDLLKPALNQMTEDLRAKVRAMLGSS